MANLLTFALVFCFLAAIYRWRAPILGALRRFDARNAARAREEFEARFDPLAHYRQTLRIADEQVEPVAELSEPDPATGRPVTRYMFLAERYATREEAEAARRAAVAEKARVFYAEMDRIILGRRPSHRPGRRLPAPEPSKSS